MHVVQNLVKMEEHVIEIALVVTSVNVLQGTLAKTVMTVTTMLLPCVNTNNVSRVENTALIHILGNNYI